MTAVAFFLKNQPGEYEREARLLLHSLHRFFAGIHRSPGNLMELLSVSAGDSEAFRGIAK